MLQNLYRRGSLRQLLKPPDGIVPASGAFWAALRPLALEPLRVDMEASAQCCKELSACCMTVVPRMFFGC
jgi:hypothetical protein